MTRFEKLCMDLCVPLNTLDAENLAEIVNDLIFNCNLTDDEICEQAEKTFRKKYGKKYKFNPAIAE